MKMSNFYFDCLYVSGRPNCKPDGSPSIHFKDETDNYHGLIIRSGCKCVPAYNFISRNLDERVKTLKREFRISKYYHRVINYNDIFIYVSIIQKPDEIGFVVLRKNCS